MYWKPSFFKPFPCNQLATKAQSFPRKSPNTVSPMIARQNEIVGAVQIPHPQCMEIKFPTPLEDSDNQIPSSPGRQRCQMPGVCPGGGGGGGEHVEASIWPIHKEDKSYMTSLDPNSSYPNMDQIVITSTGIQKLWDSLNANKAGGPDNVSSRILWISSIQCLHSFSNNP